MYEKFKEEVICEFFFHNYERVAQIEIITSNYACQLPSTDHYSCVTRIYYLAGIHRVLHCHCCIYCRQVKAQLRMLSREELPFRQRNEEEGKSTLAFYEVKLR